MNLAATPSRFRRSPKTQTSRSRRAFKPGGPGDRLMTELGVSAYLFRLEVSDLDAGISDTPGGLYDRQTISTLAAAAARLFDGPCFVVFEAGRGDLYAPQRGRLHAHVIAHQDDGPPQLVRGSERCKKVFDAPGLYRYLHKSDSANLEAVLEYAAVCVLSESRRPPRTRRHFFSAKRSAWVAAHCTNDLTLNPAPAAAAAHPVNDRPDTPPATGFTDCLNSSQAAAAAAAAGKRAELHPGTLARAAFCFFRPPRPPPPRRPRLQPASVRARGPPPPRDRARPLKLSHSRFDGTKGTP